METNENKPIGLPWSLHRKWCFSKSNRLHWALPESRRYCFIKCWTLSRGIVCAFPAETYNKFMLSCDVTLFLWFKVPTKAITNKVTYYIREQLCHKCLIETSPHSACKDIWDHLLRLVGLSVSTSWKGLSSEMGAGWKAQPSKSQVLDSRPKLFPAASTRQYADPGVQAGFETQAQKFNCSTSPNPPSALCLPLRPSQMKY